MFFGHTENVRAKFSENFPNSTVPHRNTVRDLINKFRDFGDVSDDPRSGCPRVLTEYKMLDIADRTRSDN
jgi:hypothetical protein